MIEHKTCRACGKLKTVDEFNRHAKGHMGLEAKCRACRSETKRLERNREPARFDGPVLTKWVCGPYARWA